MAAKLYYKALLNRKVILQPWVDAISERKSYITLPILHKELYYKALLETHRNTQRNAERRREIHRDTQSGAERHGR